MDAFGSNATPMGGSCGRADAMIGAVEAQKAEGVLHLHFFLYVQMAHQFQNLSEIAEQIKHGMLSAPALKRYQNEVRCAKYPDLGNFEGEKEALEKAWPAFETDYALNLPPSFVWEPLRQVPAAPLNSLTSLESWEEEGRSWLRLHDRRLQFVMARMNHHIHPLVPGTDERRPLPSCQPTGKPK